MVRGVTKYIHLLRRSELSTPRQWYVCLKRISAFDQHSRDLPTVEEISSFSDQDQAELIAEHFLKIPNSYEPLKSDDVIFSPFSD